MTARLYTVCLDPDAEHFLDKLRDRNLYRRLRAAVDSLALNPRPPGCKKLRGRLGYRVRVGDYRIIYRVLDDRLIITVIAIGDRKDIYR